MLTEEEIRSLECAHTGDDFETVCWAAAEEIRKLRSALDTANQTCNRHAHIIKNFAIGGDAEALRSYALKSRILVAVK